MSSLRRLALLVAALAPLACTGGAPSGEGPSRLPARSGLGCDCGP